MVLDHETRHYTSTYLRAVVLVYDAGTRVRLYPRIPAHQSRTSTSMVLQRNAHLAKVSCDSLCLTQLVAVSTLRFSSSRVARCHSAHQQVRYLLPFSSLLLPVRSTTFFLRHCTRESLSWLSLQPNQSYGRPGAVSRQRGCGMLPLLVQQHLLPRNAAPESSPRRSRNCSRTAAGCLTGVVVGVADADRLNPT